MLARVVSSFKIFGAEVRSRRKTVGLFLLALGLGLTALLVFAHPTLAADATTPNFFSTDYWILLLASILLAIAGFFIKITIFILTFVITLAGYNGYLDSTAVNVGWVMIRDVTNMAFVVILLVIAFGTILGLEQYEWKKLLGKFVFAAILVNFSRTICGVIIDVAQVFMTTFVNGIAATAGGNVINAFQLNKILDLADGVSPQATGSATAQFVAAVGGVTFAAMVMAVMLVFLYMLVGRVISLWILIVLSPFAFVLSILPSTESYAGEWWHKFISNVITGPVLIFFVWLSFVTLGGGNIAGDIASPDHNALQTNRLEGDAGTNGIGSAEQTAGISAILSWTKMASFAIAVGMLLAGAKAAQELGGFGADALDSATEFGFKAAKYASGLAAARWTGENVVAPAAKWTGMKLVGEPVQRLGKVIKARAELKKNEWDLARNERVKKWEENARTKGGIGNNLKAKVLGALWETSGRKNKRAEDWEKAAENKHTEVEESYSTSKSASGLAKLRTGVMAEMAEHLSEAKKKEKYAKEKEKLLAVAAAHDKKSKDYKDAHTFHDREDKAAGSEANAEEINKQLHRNEELTVAKKRDAILAARNQTPRYKEQVLAKHTKEDMELAGSSDYDRTAAKVAYLRDQIRAQRKVVDQETDPDKKAAANGKLKNLVTDMASLQAFNNSRGSIFGGGGLGTALADSDAGESLKNDAAANDARAHQANELAAILQRKVAATKDGVDGALKELQKTLGDGFGTFMQSFTAGLAHAADDGSVNKAGLFKEQFDAKTGETKFEAVDSNDEWRKGKVEWATGQAKPVKIQGFAGSVDNVGGQLKITSDMAQDRIADMFGNVTQNIVSSIDKANIDNFNEAFTNMQKAEIDKLMAKMLAKAQNPQGLGALFKRTKLKEIYASKGGSNQIRVGRGTEAKTLDL